MRADYQVKVRAEVVDASVDRPTSEDVLLTDTNVLAFISYPKVRMAYHQEAYGRFVKDARRAGTKLLRSPLSASELLGLIERREHTLFLNNGGRCDIKEYRHEYPEERAKVVAAFNLAWGQLCKFTTHQDVTIDGSFLTACIAGYGVSELDGHDFVLVEAAERSGVTSVLSDDIDFATVPGVRLFTANPRALDQARAAGQLVVR